jgi:crotonobetainyl-CoA:carnitine CoA-transferase CaiB-like acyl-CoA transferase
VRIHTASTTPDTRVPWLGEDTDTILHAELGLSPDEVEALRADGIVA